MRKNQLKKITLKSLIFLGLIFLVFNCQKDDDALLDEDKGNVKLKKISFDEFKNKTRNKTFKLISKYLKNNKTVFDNDVTILTDEIIMFSNNDSQTDYTFKLLLSDNTDSNTFYNLILSLDQTNTVLNYYVLKYEPDESWQSDTTQPFYGLVSAVNDVFQENDIDNLFNRTTYSCVTGYSSTWTCSNGVPGHAPGNPGRPTCKANSFEYLISLNWGTCTGNASGVTIDIPTTSINENVNIIYTQGPGNGPDGNSNLGTTGTQALSPEHWQEIELCLGGTDLNNTNNSYNQAMSTWLQNPDNRTVAKTINNYLKASSCNVQNQQFAIEAILALMNGGEVDFDEQVINNLENICAKNIFTEIEDGIYEENLFSPEVEILTQSITLNFAEHILMMFNNIPIFSYNISNSDINGVNASTGFSQGNIYTTLSNNYLQNATSLSIARTIIHELVHAYLSARYFLPVTTNSFSFSQAMKDFAIENGYNPDGSAVEQNLFHHEFMGQYVDAIAYSLYEWDKDYGTGGNLGWDYYRSMSFGGLYYYDQSNNLVYTDSFIELVPDAAERTAIINIITNEQNGTNQALGTNCN